MESQVDQIFTPHIHMGAQYTMLDFDREYIKRREAIRREYYELELKNWLEMAVSCDLRLGADHPEMKFNQLISKVTKTKYRNKNLKALYHGDPQAFQQIHTFINTKSDIVYFQELLKRINKHINTQTDTGLVNLLRRFHCSSWTLAYLHHEQVDTGNMDNEMVARMAVCMQHQLIL